MVIMTFFSFNYYSTAKTDESVFIIGGYNGYPPRGTPDRRRTVAEYKDGSWRNVGKTIDNRYSQKSITLGSTVMIFGGGK